MRVIDYFFYAAIYIVSLLISRARLSYEFKAKKGGNDLHLDEGDMIGYFFICIVPVMNSVVAVIAILTFLIEFIPKRKNNIQRFAKRFFNLD